MTTEIIKHASPRLPRPDAYKAYLDRVLPDPQPLWRRVLAGLRAKLLRIFSET